MIKAPNAVFGPEQPKEEDGVKGDGVNQGVDTLNARGFDCAPPDGICIEPQYWYYRKAELVASGKSHGAGHI